MRYTSNVPALYQFETIAIGYFGALVAVAVWSSGPWRRRLAAAGAAAATAGLVLVLAAVASADVRGWVAHLYLVLAYWLPALLVTRGPNTALEEWLRRTDAAWQKLGFPLPAWGVSVLELMYLSCYPFVPFAFTLVWTLGDAADIDRFWTAVLVAGCICYGSLPWVVSRPPRFHVSNQAGTQREPDVALRRLNVGVLKRVSHGLITFPSGHVAVSIAAALAVCDVSWAAGSVLLVIAAGIAGGAVVGGYHYVVDVVIGCVVGVLAATLHYLGAVTGWR